MTNSSSSNYVFWGFYSRILVDYLIELIQKGYIYLDRGNSPIKEDLNGCMISDRQESGKAYLDSLRFFPFKDGKEKTGFQIEETINKHYDAFDALISFINVENRPKEEADLVRSKLKKLVETAQENQQILFESKTGTTEDFNYCFDEREDYRGLFRISENGKAILSCIDKNAESIVIDSIVPCSAIGESAFAGCTSLKTIRFESKYQTPLHNSSIPSLYADFSYLGGRIETIQKNAFAGCLSLNAMAFKCSKIGQSAFAGCESLEAVEFDDGIKQIGGLAFAGCANLKQVFFADDPNNFDYKQNRIDYGIQSISPSAFKNCPNAVLYVFEGTYAHQFARENNLRFEIRSRFPKKYRVEKITQKRLSIARTLQVGEEVIVNHSKNQDNPFEFEVLTSEGKIIGYIYETRFAASEIIRVNNADIKATVSSLNASVICIELKQK